MYLSVVLVVCAYKFCLRINVRSASSIEMDFLYVKVDKKLIGKISIEGKRPTHKEVCDLITTMMNQEKLYMGYTDFIIENVVFKHEDRCILVHVKTADWPLVVLANTFKKGSEATTLQNNTLYVHNHSIKISYSTHYGNNYKLKNYCETDVLAFASFSVEMENGKKQVNQVLGIGIDFQIDVLVNDGLKAQMQICGA